MSKMFVIDLDLCRDCGVCTAQCGYHYHGGANSGVARLREVVGFELACRRCEAHSCVEACPNEALEVQTGGVLKRYNMRCTGCFSCGHACPFGNIVAAALQFRDAVCDLCAGADGAPECVLTCEKKALRVEGVAEGQEDLCVLGDRLAVKCRVWRKKEPVKAK
jgi:Fe-S-cluster-containing hydrogenase component 2